MKTDILAHGRGLLGHRAIDVMSNTCSFSYNDMSAVKKAYCENLRIKTKTGQQENFSNIFIN